jgi:hypothetical protein
MNHAEAALAFSSVIEKTLEHRFLGDLCAHLWTEGIYDFAISQSEVDHYGYDVTVEVGKIVRHIQLKLSHVGGKRSRVGINTRLGDKPSGCVVWMFYRPADLTVDHYRWFGGAPGERLPPLGDVVTHHTKGDSTGYKAERAGHRNISKSIFDRVDSIPDLAHLLFGIQ